MDRGANRGDFALCKFLHIKEMPVILAAVKSNGPFGCISGIVKSVVTFSCNERTFGGCDMVASYKSERWPRAVLHRNKVSEFKLERICRAHPPSFHLRRRVRSRLCASHGYK